MLSRNERHRQANESADGMRQEFLMMSGVTKADRHQVTVDVNDAISAAGGWVVDHTLFSNIAITIQFSLPSLSLNDFRNSVVAANVKLDDDSIARIKSMVGKHAPKPLDIAASLNITFIHNEPDLRREVPAVPG